MTTSDETRAPARVVVVGAGFAGLEAARALACAPVRVTVVDRRNHHLFQPLLYQVATAALNPSDISALIRIVGAGPTGVELAGALAEIAARTLASDFRHIRPESARVVLVEARRGSCRGTRRSCRAPPCGRSSGSASRCGPGPA